MIFKISRPLLDYLRPVFEWLLPRMIEFFKYTIPELLLIVVGVALITALWYYFFVLC